MNRGDVVLVTFPNADVHEAKLRPALIVQTDNLQTEFSQVILAMITSRTIRQGHPSRVLITLDSDAGRLSGLLSDSVVMTDNLATVQTWAIDRVIGQLPMTQINFALRHTLNL